MKSKRVKLTRETCNEKQLRCWRALSWLVGGDHHIYSPVYECGHGIQTTMRGEAATTDGDRLTRMAVIAHADAVRISIDGTGGPGMYRLMLHPREHGQTCCMSNHPTLDDLIARIAKSKAMIEEERKSSGGEQEN